MEYALVGKWVSQCTLYPKQKFTRLCPLRTLKEQCKMLAEPILVFLWFSYYV